MEDVQIRPLREEEAEAASSLTRLILRHTWEHYQRGIYPKRALEFDMKTHSPSFYSALSKAKDHYCFVAEVRGEEHPTGELVGVALGRIAGASGFAGLSWLGVHPQHQGKGVGEKLLRHVLDYCRRIGCHKLSLHTLPVLRPAISLYLKAGFLPEAFLRRQWWGVDFLLMSIWLDEQPSKQPSKKR